MSKESFKFYEREKMIDTVETRTSKSYWRDVFSKLLKNKPVIIAIFVVLIIVLISIFAPMFSAWGIEKFDKPYYNTTPSARHWFGTDALARDVWTRTWSGTQLSLLLAVTVSAISIAIGIVYGSVSGFVGRRTDSFMQAIVEILWNIPDIVIFSILLLALKANFGTFVLALTLTSWISLSRLVRGLVMKYRDQEFVMASQTLGASKIRLMFRHILPNILGNVIISATLLIPSVIFFEAFLSYIGLGFAPPAASLGVMISEGQKVMLIYPYMVLPPAIIMSLLLLSFTLIGNGLRDALDPYTRSED